MKIKEVCLRTGLTDRTVRFYIEEGLISPAYTENYLGRKAFDFSEEDVAALSDIAVLREFEFSVEEIRRMLTDPACSREVIATVKARTRERLGESRRQMEALDGLDADAPYPISELAHSLSLPEKPAVLPADTGKRRIWRTVLAALRALATLALILLPPVLGGVFLWLRTAECTHPVAEPWLIFLLIITCLPSVFALVSLFVPLFKRWIPTRVLLLSCLCAIPLCAVLSLNAVVECTHTWSDFSTDVAASCTASGRITRSCERCTAVDFAITDPTGHTSVTDREIPPTCTQEGKSEGSHCAACGEVFVAQTPLERLPHAPVPLSERAPSCTETGSTGGSACEACGTLLEEPTVLEPLGHAIVRSEAIAPTCIMGGMTEGAYCQRCNVRITPQTVLEPLGHVSRELPYIPPTCTEDGYEMEIVCRNCGMVLGKAEAIPATGHTPVTDAGVEPTCKEKGLSDGAHCGVCGEILEEQKEIPAIPSAHKVVTVEGREPTCSMEGKVGYSYCEHCKITLTEGGDYIPKLPHTLRYTETVRICGSTGYDIFSCTGCDFFERRNWDDSLSGMEHSFSAHADTTGEWLCERCGTRACLYGTLGEGVDFYITGGRDETERSRTLVIRGAGEVPDFKDPPPWVSTLLCEVETVVIGKGIVRVGSGAFDMLSDGSNPYAGVTSFVLQSPYTEIVSMGGIECEITYGNTLADQAAGSAYIRFLLHEFEAPAGASAQYSTCDADLFGAPELILRLSEGGMENYLFFEYKDGVVRRMSPDPDVNMLGRTFYDVDDMTGFLL